MSRQVPDKAATTDLKRQLAIRFELKVFGLGVSALTFKVYGLGYKGFRGFLVAASWQLAVV